MPTDLLAYSSPLGAVLSASGPEEFDSASFLCRHNLSATAVWRRGDLSATGRVREDSGFVMDLGDCESPEALCAGLTQHLRKNAAMLAELEKSRVAVEIGVLVPIEPSRVAARYVYFPPELLALAGACAVGIEVTACLVEEGSGEDAVP